MSKETEIMIGKYSYTEAEFESAIVGIGYTYSLEEIRKGAAALRKRLRFLDKVERSLS